MAERGEAGPGRLAEVPEIIAAAKRDRSPSGAHARDALVGRPLAGRHVLVTSGPTHEPIDPVRYIANRSSGKQGHAIAAAAAALGARVTLVIGAGVAARSAGRRRRARRDGRRRCSRAVQRGLPADVAVFAAAVADWRVASRRREKIKKIGRRTPALDLVENPDILKTVGTRAPAAAGARHRLCRRDRQRDRRTPRRSASRRAPTGSSPTTCRRRPA